MTVLQTLRERWGIGMWPTIAVLAAFSLAGTTTVLLKAPVTGAILPPNAPGWVQWSVYLAVMVPLYQALLLGYGLLLGQFHFFWQRMQAVGRFVGRGSATR